MDKREFQNLIKTAGKKLDAAGIESPTAEVEIILEHLLEVERLNLYLHGAQLIDENILGKFREIVDRRITRYPLQYILGEAWFYGRRFKVTPAVMIPTPETEILCELAINYITNEALVCPDILDIGVGSGVISVTVAAELPDARLTAIDISAEALEVARQNAVALGQSGRIEFVRSNGFESLSEGRKFDLVLSNPPYIAEDEYVSLPTEVLADPKISLVSGDDGLDFIRLLIKESPRYLKEKGRLMFEIGYDQADKIMELTRDDNRYRSLSIIKDLNEIDRVVILSI